MGDRGGREFPDAGEAYEKLNHTEAEPHKENNCAPSLPTASMLNSLQVFLGASVAMDEGQGCAIFGGGGGAISLFFQQMTESVMFLEGGIFLNGRGEIAAQQANSQRILSVSALKNGGRVAQ